MGYQIPSDARVRENPGVTAIMGVSNGRGAYARNLKITPKTKVGGLSLRTKPLAKYAKAGATKPKHYAAPGYKYPIRTERRPGESIEQWHERDRVWVRHALSRFGQHEHQYTPQMRKVIATNIAKAAKAVGQDSPKAMEYRVTCGVDKAGRSSAKTNGGNMALRFRRVSNNPKRLRKAPKRIGFGRRRDPFDIAPTMKRYPAPTARGSVATPRPGSLPRFDLPPEGGRRIGKKGPKLRIGQRRGPAVGYFEPVAPKPSGRRIGKKAPLLQIALKRKAKPKGKPAASKKAARTSTGASKMAAKAKKKLSKASIKRRQKAGQKKYWADVKAGRVKRKGYKAGKAAAKSASKRKPSKKATKSGSAKKRTTKLSRRSAAKRHWAAVRAGKATHKGFKLSTSGKVRSAGKRKAAKKAPAKKSAAKKRTRKSTHPESLYEQYAANKRRGHKRARRNPSSMPSGSMSRKITALGVPVLTGAGGYAVHRIGTSLVANLIAGFLPGTMGRIAAALATAAAGVYVANKFLPKYAFNASIGMGLSTFGVAVKELVPSFADYTGFSGIPSASLLPRYSTGQYMQAAAGNPFLQASAGDPFLQAAAGEYYSVPQLGEYFSQDMFNVPGAEGQFAMNKIDVQGDTGAYEFHDQFGAGATNLDEGLAPGANMDSAFNFMEAAAGVGPASQSTYIPHERALPAGQSSTSTDEGIFDTGGIFA